MTNRKSNESILNPLTWCDPEVERTTLLDYSSSPKLDLNEVLYALNAFWATLKPVALSLLLSSLAVIYIQSEATRQDKQSGLKVYEISDDDANTDDETRDSNSTKLGKSLINAIVIICVIAMFTFVLVFCYWMRCMKFLLGYMIFSSGLLLSLLGGIIWYTALIKWDLPCDSYTFFFVLYNFAIVGIIAIFYQKGIPTIITQAYLVCTSVILAWQLSRFDEWTCWSLLLMLALYDLCAVLTPCGPLKMLVGLMQERNEPLPGLLYEASLPSRTDFSQNQSTTQQQQQQTTIPSPMSLGVGIGIGPILMGTSGYTKPDEEEENQQRPARHSDSLSHSSSSAGTDLESSDHGLLRSNTNFSGNISLTEAPVVRRIHPITTNDGNIPNQPSHSNNRNQNFQSLNEHENDQEDDKEHSIKLGLGDFVFYSVLVSRAATYGFTAFAACSLVILGGLGMTLVLLSVFRKALPALPISIFLGIFFYLCTRFIIVPFIEEATGGPIYM